VVDNADNLTYDDVVINGKQVDKPTVTGPVKLHTD
jgi:hypothetical protein